jgi:hypothetical protein
MRAFSIAAIALPLFSAALAAQQGASIDLPSESQMVLQAKGAGVQIYTCTNVHDAFAWTLKAPDARLYDAAGKLIGTHFAGPTWRLTDGSQVQGELIASRPSPEANSVPWLLLRAKAGTGAGSFANVAFIRRTETHGGVAPATGCRAPADLDKSLRVPYSALYTFYSAK